MYQNGQLCEEKQVVEAELKSLVNDSVTYISKGSGGYEVTYTPEVHGRYTLSVRVNGTDDCWQSISSVCKDPAR